MLRIPGKYFKQQGLPLLVRNNPPPVSFFCEALPYLHISSFFF